MHEDKHDFVRLRYVKENGLPAFYSPDFLVRTASSIYLVETKAQGQVAHPNVKPIPQGQASNSPRGPAPSA